MVLESRCTFSKLTTVQKEPIATKKSIELPSALLVDLAVSTYFEVGKIPFEANFFMMELIG